jgi:hypothetical protein
LEKDWSARFERTEIQPLPRWVPWLIAECAPIPGPWWAQILAIIGILALFGMKNSKADKTA